MKIFIYTLSDPNTNEIRYVGKSYSPTIRYKNHINQSKIHHSHVNRWINKLLEQPALPILNIIEECNESNWEEREIYWIAYYKQLYPNLCNIRKGGNEPAPKNPKTISKCNYYKGKYRTNYFSKGNSIYLGSYNTKQEAEKAYDDYVLNGIIELTNPKKRKVLLISSDFTKEFNSVTECALFLNTSPTNISRCCKGKAKTHKGCTFKYK